MYDCIEAMIFALIKTKISVIKFGQNIFCSVLFVVGNKLELFFKKKKYYKYTKCHFRTETKYSCGISDPKVPFPNSPLIVLVLNRRSRLASTRNVLKIGAPGGKDLWDTRDLEMADVISWCWLCSCSWNVSLKVSIAEQTFQTCWIFRTGSSVR